MNKLILKLKDKNILYSIVVSAVIIFLVILFGKLVIYDSIIGTKIYDENDIVIRYHRYVNIVTIKNNSDCEIYMHYQHGRSRKDANLDKGSLILDIIKNLMILKLSQVKSLLNLWGYLMMHIFLQ